MSDSIIVKIEEKIVYLIKNISADWGDDSIDIDKFPPDRIDLPCAKLELTAEVNIDESDDDAIGPTGAFAGAYYNALSYKIIMKGKLSDRKKHLEALDDLKKVFGVHYTLEDSGASAIMYRGFKFVKKDKDNEHLEADDLMMESTWIVRYYQSRTEPGEVAEV